MASLIDVRDLLALQGRMEASEISAALQTPGAMIDAILAHMEVMGLVVRVQEKAPGCLTANCKACPEGKSTCLREWWTLR